MSEIELTDEAKSAGVEAQDLARLMDIFGPEDLHADLVPYVSESNFGKGIFHPLVHEPFYVDALNKRINKMYEAKTQALDEAITEENWSKFIFLHERPYRAQALEEVIFTHEVDDPETVWSLVASVWTDSENIYQNYDAWVELWDLDIPNRELVMNEAERQGLASLSETITVYRGVNHPDALPGMSWTTDRKKAEWFAYRFASADRPAMLAVGEVRKADVLAHFLGRNELEIVALPENVTMTIKKLPIRKSKR